MQFPRSDNQDNTYQQLLACIKSNNSAGIYDFTQLDNGSIDVVRNDRIRRDDGTSVTMLCALLDDEIAQNSGFDCNYECLVALIKCFNFPEDPNVLLWQLIDCKEDRFPALEALATNCKEQLLTVINCQDLRSAPWEGKLTSKYARNESFNNFYGFTPAMLAAYVGNLRCLKLFMELGAAPIISCSLPQGTYQRHDGTGLVFSRENKLKGVLNTEFGKARKNEITVECNVLHIALRQYRIHEEKYMRFLDDDNSGDEDKKPFNECVEFLISFRSGLIKDLNSYGTGSISFAHVMRTKSPDIISSYLINVIETQLVDVEDDLKVFDQLLERYQVYTSKSGNTCQMENIRAAMYGDSALEDPTKLEALSYEIIKNCYDSNEYESLNNLVGYGFRISPQLYIRNELNLLLRIVYDDNIDALEQIVGSCGDSSLNECWVSESPGWRSGTWFLCEEDRYLLDGEETKTAAILAIKLGRDECLQLLIGAGAKCVSEHWNILHRAFGSPDRKAIVEFLLSAKSSLQDYGSLLALFSHAVCSNNAEYVKAFISACESQGLLAHEELSDICEIMDTGIKIGNEDIVSQLIQLGVDNRDMHVFSSAFHTPLSMHSDKEMCFSCIRLIMGNEVGVQSINTPLPIKERPSRRGAFDQPDSTSTPLMLAVSSRSNDYYYRLLLECPTVDVSGTVPLALKHTWDKDLVKVLVKRGCSATVNDLIAAFMHVDTSRRHFSLPEQTLDAVSDGRLSLVDVLFEDLLKQFSSADECYSAILDTIVSFVPKRVPDDAPQIVLKFVQGLIAKGARCDVIRGDGSTGLLQGAKKSHPQWDRVVETIISVMDKKYLDVKNADKDSALEVWFKREQYNLCAYALAQGAAVSVATLDTDHYVDKVLKCIHHEETPPDLYVQYVLTDLPFELVVKGDNKLVQFRPHHHSFTRFLAKESGYKISDAIQLKIAVDVLKYCHNKDSRWPIALVRYADQNCKALPAVESVMKSYILFCGRYDLQPGPPMHRSATAVVLMAEDKGRDRYYKSKFLQYCSPSKDTGSIDDSSLSLAQFADCLTALSCSIITGDRSATHAKIISECDKVYQNYKAEDSAMKLPGFLKFCEDNLPSSVKVAIKLMTDKEQYSRELDVRSKGKFDDRYIMGLMEGPTPDEFIEAVREHKLSDGKPLVDYVHGLVMPAADRSLEAIFRSERPDIEEIRSKMKQVATALGHLHTAISVDGNPDCCRERVMHGDIKMLNVVRTCDRMCLIDMDAASAFDDINSSHRNYAGAKFSSAVLPPEMFYILKNDDEERMYLDYCKDWAVRTGNSKNPEFIIKLNPIKYQSGSETSSIVVRTFYEHVDKPLPYELVRASGKIDVWSFGVMIYQLCSGVSLFASNRDDDIRDGRVMHLVANLTDMAVADLIDGNIVDRPAAALLKRVLRVNPDDRPDIAGLHSILEDPFFNANRSTRDPHLADMLNKQNQMLEVMRAVDERTKLINDRTIKIEHMSSSIYNRIIQSEQLLLKGLFEATEVCTPTCFVVLENLLPSPAGKATKPKELENGPSMKSSLLRGLSKLGRALSDDTDTVKECIDSLVVGSKYYLYLVDEYTMQPVEGEGYPIEITTPKEFIPKVLPLLKVGLKAMAAVNTVARMGRCLGLPVIAIPHDMMSDAQTAVGRMDEPSSVSDYDSIQNCVLAHKNPKGEDVNTTDKQGARGASLRELTDFLCNNPNDSKKKFCGLRRICTPKGFACWTMPDNVAFVQKSSRYLDAEAQCDPVENVVSFTPPASTNTIISTNYNTTIVKGKCAEEELIEAVDTSLSISTGADDTRIPVDVDAGAAGSTSKTKGKVKKSSTIKQSISDQEVTADKKEVAVGRSAVEVDPPEAVVPPVPPAAVEDLSGIVKTLKSEVKKLKVELEKQSSINVSLAAASASSAKAQEDLAHAISLLGETMPKSLYTLKEEVERMSESMKTTSRDAKPKGRLW